METATANRKKENADFQDAEDDADVAGNDDDDGGGDDDGDGEAAGRITAPTSDPVRGLCWSPLGEAPSGCRLCVTAGLVSAVHEASATAFDADWRVASLLQPLLRQAWRAVRA